jgi:hypothetical protein
MLLTRVPATALVGSSGESALHCAVKNDQFGSVMMKQLVKAGCPVNCTDKYVCVIIQSSLGNYFYFYFFSFLAIIFDTLCRVKLRYITQ